MKITRKREFFIERERSLTIRFAANTRQLSRFCGACQTESSFLTVDEAAILTATTSRRIFRLVETNQLHSDETPEGLLVVCLASLKNAAAIQIGFIKGEK